MLHRLAIVMAALVFIEATAAAQPATRPSLQDLLLDALRTVPAPAVLSGAAAAREEALEPGKDAPLACSGRTSAVKLKITQIGLHDEFGGAKAEAGRKLLVLKTSWENVIPVNLGQGKAESTAYLIPSLRDHLYILLNGREVGRVHPKFAEIAGHLPSELKLDRPGVRVSGDLVFDISSNEPLTIELRLYDSKQGDLALALLARKDATLPEAKAIGALQRTAVLEAGVFALKKADGQVHVDFRARSLVMLMGKIATVADWPEWRKYMALVVDGEYACAPLEESALAAEPRFLPDVLTGGAVAFAAPPKYTSLELRCDFPGSSAPGVKGTQSMTFALKGERPAAPDRPAIASGVDEMFKLSVWGQALADEFAGQKAKAGKRFLVLDATVANTADGGEWFQVAQQLKYATAKGAIIAIDPASAKAPLCAGELLWIPGKERRSFQIAFQIDGTESKPRLIFVGGQGQQTLNLRPIEQIAAKEPDLKPSATTRIAVTPTQTPAPPKQPETTPKQPETMPRQPEEQPKQPAEPAPKTAEPTAARYVAPAKLPDLLSAPIDPENPMAGLPIRVAARQDSQPRGLAGVGLKAEQVNAAIDRGAAFLWQEVTKKRERLTTSGTVPLIYLALVHAGHHKNVPACDAAVRKYLTDLDADNVSQVYDAGVIAMLIDSYGEKAFLPKAYRIAQRMVGGEQVGTWYYSAMDNPAPPGEPIPDVKMDRPIKRLRADPEDPTLGDTSVTQFGVLGLFAAQRLGITIDRGTWQRNLAAMRLRQSKFGGWGYHGEKGEEPYGSMACAGICMLAIDRHFMGEKNADEDEAIERGLGFLTRFFSVKENPRQSSHLYYYLYSLERVGRILNTEFIGPHEWYPLGARQLVDSQAKGGWWSTSPDDPEQTVWDTSFGLLFLTRATPTIMPQPKVVQTQPVQIAAGGVLQTEANPRGGRYYFILDASGSMLEEMDGKPKFEIARDAVAAIVREMPADSQVALRVYGHRKRAIEQGASEDTALEIAMDKLDREAFLAKLSGLRARGKTPLALSMRQAAEDLAGDSQPTTVVLLTDGAEDTMPRQDPYAAADALGALKHVKVRIVGFDIGRDDWARELAAITRRAGGSYWPAPKADRLRAELRTLVLGGPEEFEIVNEQGRSVERGRFGQSKSLAPGAYRIRAVFNGTAYEKSFTLDDGQTVSAAFGDMKPVGQVAAPPAQAVQSPATTQPVRPAKPVKKFCTSCGASIKPGAKFCTGCGGRVD